MSFSNYSNASGPSQVNAPLVVHQSQVQQSVDVGCVISNCGWGAVKCVGKCVTSIPCYIDCVGSAAPDCIACFS